MEHMNQEIEQEEVEFQLSNDVIEAITKCASKCTREAYREEIERHKEDAIKDRRKAVTHELDRYRSYQRMLNIDMRFTPAEMYEYRFEFLKDLMGDSLKKFEADYPIKKEIDRKKRIQYRKSRIDYAFRCYKEETDASNSDEEKRRYRIAWERFIRPDKLPIEQIAENENVSKDTAFRDLRIAVDKLDVYLCSGIVD